MEKTGKNIIYMVGPSLQTQGGISSVLNAYKAGFSGRLRLVFIPSYSGSGRFKDIVFFVFALVRVFLAAAFNGNSIFHIHMASKGSYLRKSMLSKLPLLFGRKVIFHIHGAMFDKFMENAGDRRREKIVRTLTSAGKVLVLSKSWQEYFGRYLPAGKLEVVYNPSSTYDGEYTPKNNPVPVVLFMGRLGQRKGAYDLLQAALWLEPGSFDLRMYGDGELEEVRRYAEANLPGASVEVKGWVKHSEVERLYEAADILTLPSYAEGLPMSVLEAIGKGLPVVATNVGGIPEAVIDGENGFIIRPGDISALVEKLAILLKDKELREKMGRNSLKIARERFSVESIGNKLERIYNEVLDNEKRIYDKKAPEDVGG